ncbi:MAG: hypothetical protein KC587_15870, partial [Nitrospira sp.]|nr:hypothetical protein [Nitrospira sp.]
LYFQWAYCTSKEVAEAAGDSLSALQLPAFTPVADSLLAFLGQHPGARFFIDLRYNPGGSPLDGYALAERIAAIPDINQKGKLYIGINGYSGAAPMLIAQAFRRQTNAIIIGEPPAENPGHDGQKDFLKLPNSGLQVFYPQVLLPVPAGSKGPFMPDVVVPMAFEAFKNGRDPVLDYLRAH